MVMNNENETLNIDWFIQRLTYAVVNRNSFIKKKTLLIHLTAHEREKKTFFTLIKTDKWEIYSNASLILKMRFIFLFFKNSKLILISVSQSLFKTPVKLVGIFDYK